NTRDYAFDKSWIGATPFWLAAAFQDTAMMQVLSVNGADLQAAKSDGTTPLIGAAQWESRRAVPKLGVPRPIPPEEEHTTLEAVKLAIFFGADVNAANDHGDTALHRVAAKRYNTVVQFLADAGATLDVKNKEGQTPLAIASQDVPLPNGSFDAE